LVVRHHVFGDVRLQQLGGLYFAQHVHQVVRFGGARRGRAKRMGVSDWVLESERVERLIDSLLSSFSIFKYCLIDVFLPEEDRWDGGA
jgi:hypothetical protein